MSLSIFTIGYENRSLPELIATLQSQDIQKIIDVRQYPHSRRREFSKQALATALNRAGLGYISVRELGTPQSVRQEYKATGDLDQLLQKYQTYLDGHPELLTLLAELVGEMSCCLLCYEHDHSQCHREVLAQQLELKTEESFPIRHL